MAVLVVARRMPDLEAIRRALLTRGAGRAPQVVAHRARRADGAGRRRLRPARGIRYRMPRACARDSRLRSDPRAAPRRSPDRRRRDHRPEPWPRLTGRYLDALAAAHCDALGFLSRFVTFE